MAVLRRKPSSSDEDWNDNHPQVVGEITGIYQQPGTIRIHFDSFNNHTKRFTKYAVDLSKKDFIAMEQIIKKQMGM